MGESPSARTERELAELRGRIGADVELLLARVRDDADPRNLVRRQPAAVFGALGSVAALAAAGVAARVRSARRKVPDTEIERIIERLGGRVDRLKGRARKRLRAQLRREMADVVERRGAKEALWGAGMAALTAGAATAARGFASRLTGDDPGRGVDREGSPRELTSASADRGAGRG